MQRLVVLVVRGTGGVICGMGVSVVSKDPSGQPLRWIVICTYVGGFKR